MVLTWTPYQIDYQTLLSQNKMTDEVVMLKEKRLLVTVTGDWNDFGEQQSSVLQGRDKNLFEVEFRNDLMDSPLAVDWKVLMVVVAVRVDDRTNDWVKLMRAMAMVVIDRYQCRDCHSPLSSTLWDQS
ncbi:hypothetical protein PPACK8108_LOCUS13085 [Phakopsora pachyrhizi]|uniref:Uncharacterized protein n=1 Tax=Phakopsora pachyrhizi TaxID=170000 RepID=A0AAV0B2U5_PHAPC|nr:hypothetical protein PPACK8108_LOCUS13085 [Phakopsora pachyrhizi]